MNHSVYTIPKKMLQNTGVLISP